MANKEFKHTPGPWNYHMNGDGSYSILGEKKGEREYQWIAGFDINGEIFTDEQIANVELMAKSPEMFDVLIKVDEYFKNLQNKYKLTYTEEKLWEIVSKIINTPASCINKQLGFRCEICSDLTTSGSNCKCRIVNRVIPDITGRPIWCPKETNK